MVKTLDNLENYIFKIKADRYLRKRIPGIFPISADQTPKSIQLSTLLLGGDINNNGLINIEDYSLLVKCFGNKKAKSNCADAKPDINYDGEINGIDYNMVVKNFGKSDE